MDSAPLLPLQQHPAFTAALRRCGAAALCIDLPGAAPVQVIRRFGLSLASRGPVWLDGPDARALRRAPLALVNSDGGDTAALRVAGFRRIFTAATVAELSLTGGREARLSRMAGTWRNALRRAEAASPCLRAERLCPTHHRWLLDADRRQQRAKGFRTLPHGLLLAYAAIRPGDTLVLTALHGGTPAAAMLFLVHGAVATYQLGWSGPEGRRLACHHALLHAAMDRLADSCVRLDLGTVDTVNAPGLARFKIGTGATLRPLGGTWLRVPGLQACPAPHGACRDGAL